MLDALLVCYWIVCVLCSKHRQPEKNTEKMEKVSVLMSHMVLSGLVEFGLVAVGKCWMRY